MTGDISVWPNTYLGFRERLPTSAAVTHQRRRSSHDNTNLKSRGRLAVRLNRLPLRGNPEKMPVTYASTSAAVGSERAQRMRSPWAEPSSSRSAVADSGDMEQRDADETDVAVDIVAPLV